MKISLSFFLSLGMFAVPPADQQGSAEAEKTLSASPMMQVEGFFMALTSSNTDGRVVVHRQGKRLRKPMATFRKVREIISFSSLNICKKKMFYPATPRYFVWKQRQVPAVKAGGPLRPGAEGVQSRHYRRWNHAACEFLQTRQDKQTLPFTFNDSRRCFM